MLTLVFWNINKHAPLEQVSHLAHEQAADVVILAESHHSTKDLLPALNAGQQRLFFPDPGLSTKLVILSRFTDDRVRRVRDSGGVSIRQYSPPLGDSILVAAVHLRSKLHQKDSDQVQVCVRVGAYIREAEENVKHSRTVLLGDLNMNPFEDGVTGSEGLHAVMDRRVAERGFRKVAGEPRQFFYNPMWSHFGHGSGTPPGTYFHDSGTAVNYYWNIFDQVLFRPALLGNIREDDVKVLTELGGVGLLDPRGRPRPRLGSDHLPIVVRLRE
jgi:hypothetical protein